LILSVGRLSRRKGFDQVIQALPELLQAGVDVHYVLIGIGEDWDYLCGLARDHNVTERVHLLGHVSADDLPRWYNACDVFAMPNREINGDTEGFGMVFIEAAACAKPALSGQAGGTGAAVQEGVTGLRVDGSQTSGVTAALLQLLRNATLCEQMGQYGYQRVLREFAWETVAAKTMTMGHRDVK
jgi:phosphatidylinositol alpha-1,6-mannosyltransferase